MSGNKKRKIVPGSPGGEMEDLDSDILSDNILDECLDEIGFIDPLQHGNQSKRSCGLIKPDSNAKMIWDLLGFVFIIYQSIVIPFRLCFNEPATGVLAGFEIIQDFYFGLDILISFNTGFFSKGKLVMNR